MANSISAIKQFEFVKGNSIEFLIIYFVTVACLHNRLSQLKSFNGAATTDSWGKLNEM